MNIIKWITTYNTRKWMRKRQREEQRLMISRMERDARIARMESSFDFPHREGK